MIPVNKGAVSLVLEGSNVGRGNVWYVLHFSLVYVTSDYMETLPPVSVCAYLSCELLFYLVINMKIFF